MAELGTLFIQGISPAILRTLIAPVKNYIIAWFTVPVYNAERFIQYNFLFPFQCK
jgi:hypothetical protein